MALAHAYIDVSKDSFVGTNQPRTYFLLGATNCGATKRRDSSGFQIVEHTSAEKAFDDEERIKTAYYEETSECATAWNSHGC